MRDIIHVSFISPDTAAQAVGALLDHKVDAKDIGVYVKDRPASWNEHSPDSHTMSSGDELEKQAKQGITVTTPQDAGVGAAKGAGIGFGIGILAAIGSIMVPGVGLVIGGGALATALAGAAATTAAGAVAGGAVGYLADQGVPAQDAEALTTVVNSGGALVSVSVPSNGVDRAAIESILAKYEASARVVTPERD